MRMNVLLNLALMEGRAKTCQEATNASVKRDSLACIARSVGISVGNCRVNGSAQIHASIYYNSCNRVSV